MNALSTIRSSDPHWIAHLETQDDAMLRKLTALGILPGNQIAIEQRFPSYIVSIGRTRAALDRETVQCIFVTREQHPTTA
ncbi:MAG: ferrous iron transport protein A [Limnothrix sp. CACIAM 69d]|nr:MAG: ferrous iron transport protein A [Limnothrix sp. CACIAM 69d]